MHTRRWNTGRTFLGPGASWRCSPTVFRMRWCGWSDHRWWSRKARLRSRRPLLRRGRR